MDAIKLEGFIIACSCGGDATIEVDTGFPGEDVTKLTITCKKCNNQQVEYVH